MGVGWPPGVGPHGHRHAAVGAEQSLAEPTVKVHITIFGVWLLTNLAAGSQRGASP